MARNTHTNCDFASSKFIFQVRHCNNKKERKVIPPGIEPGTLSVLDSRDNRYTMESTGSANPLIMVFAHTHTHTQASNWCQKSQQFLSPMELKIESCDTSSEAASLSAELSVYLSATRAEQSERVSQVSHV